MLRLLLCSTAIALMLVASDVASVGAQAPGDSVRLSRYEGGPITGAFVSRVDGTWRLLGATGDTLVIANSDVWRREVRMRRDAGAVRSQRRSGAALAGALIGAGIVLATTDGLARMLVFPAAAAGALYGAGLGTVATARVGDWYWQEIP